MSARVKDLAAQGAPWRRGANWVVVVVEGGIAIALAVYILVAPQTAGMTVSTLVGVFLALSGLLRSYSALNKKTPTGTEANACRGGTELLGGLVLIVSQFLPQPGGEPVQMTGGLTFLLAGLLGTYAVLSDESPGGIHWGGLLESLLYIIVGGLFLYAALSGNYLLDTIGIILLVLGGVLVGYGLYLRHMNESRKGNQEPPGEAE